MTSPASSHSAVACANVYGRGGRPPMQPASSSAPTNRRQVPLPLSQHCAAIVAPFAVVAAGSSTHVVAGWVLAPPSSTIRFVQRVGAEVGDTLGNAVLGETLGAVGETVGEEVGDALGEALGDVLGEVGDALGDAVHGSFVNTGYQLYKQPWPAQLCSHMTSPASVQRASACAKVCSRGGEPAMQPLSKPSPT